MPPVYTWIFSSTILLSRCSDGAHVYQVEVRVRPKSSRGFAKPSEHQANGCQPKERECSAIEVLAILRQTPAPSEPAKAAFDDPSFRKDLETPGGVGSFHDLDRQSWHGVGRRPGEHRSLTAARGHTL